VRSVSRRAVLASPLALALGAGNCPATAQTPATIAYDLSTADPGRQFEPDDFNIVGIYDFDLLLAPEFERMLDLMASSPGAIGGVRAFGIFTMGEQEDLQPGTGGVVWTDPKEKPDFSLPFAALEQLTRRNLTPFISLGFFPSAVSPSPIAPPENLERWRQLVRSFFEELLVDERFGAAVIKRWWFEVWNEPNEGRFWTGSFDQYLDLYRATSDAIRSVAVDVRLGGSAMAYKPESEAEDGPETMGRFLEFLRDDPSVQCNFVSYHRKGTVDSSAPDPDRLRSAALEISALIDRIVPERADTITLVNNEADEKIGFESPYLPRMDRFAASWLTTLAADHTALSAGGKQFVAVQDNADLQLMQTPFDGRRSIYTFLDPADREDLVKLSGAVWYDVLPMLKGAVIAAESASGPYPATELHALVTSSEHGSSVLATWHPVGNTTERLLTTTVPLTGVPWPAINVAVWRIDATHSNAYAAAQSLGTASGGAFSDTDAVVIRGAQDLALAQPVTHGIATGAGELLVELSLAPFDTILYWITPFTAEPVSVPSRVTLRTYRHGIELSWAPVEHTQLLGYEITRDGEVVAGPIRPCLWVDSIASVEATYAVRSVTASGQTSAWAVAEMDSA
jgi:hypothetical protein